MDVDERRAQRRREIIAATRVLFDERGVRDAQIEDIARAVGINRAIIYRHFTGKEELFAVTLVEYLRELEACFAERVDADADPGARLGAVVSAFFDYGVDHPAFVDCAQTLLRRRGAELAEEVGDEVMIELGTAISACLGHLVAALDDGDASGDFQVDEPSLVANLLYAQGLGALNLAHLQWSVREHNTGMPVVDDVATDTLRALLVRGALAMAKGATPKPV
ncbi:MAG: TetR/AcrR family transcriptional regulator [Aeromicrobium sp.]|uniref:TetR/AcrR family transcriptional regulator n=1 Tax=Aeromicrobium sp. TaxID=1871063 RepID=UPI0039E51A95